MAYPCDSEDGNAAVMLITNLENGDTFACCGACFPVWVSSVAATMAPGEASEADPAPDDGQDRAGTAGDAADDAPPTPGDTAPRPRPKRARAGR